MTVSTKNYDNSGLRLGVLALCLLLVGTERLFGQADTGSITGTVTGSRERDPGGSEGQHHGDCDESGTDIFYGE